MDTVLKNQKRDPALKILYNWITKSSRLVTKKTPNFTASLLLLECYGLPPNLYIDEHTRLITVKNQVLQNKDKLPQYTVDHLSSQDSRLCLPLTSFHSAFDKIYD